MSDAPESLKALYQSMADHTKHHCAEGCSTGRKKGTPWSCCDPMYCGITIEYALERWGIELKPTGHERLPLMGKEGCIAEPYLRPLCTVHECNINGLGFTGFADWDKKYFELRDKISEAESELED